MTPSKQAGFRWLDAGTTAGLVVFALLISLFPIRNNDIWWHLAVGRILAGGSFITTDPFMFSVPGLPWVPHAWLSALLFYGVHALASAAGLVVLRAVLVLIILVMMLRILRHFRIPVVMAAPVVLVAILNAHSRFILRPHLFEYLFVLVLLLFLLGSGRRHTARWFALPVALQMLWVNMHASFYLGPVLVALFFAGEALAVRYAQAFESIAGFDRKTRLDMKPVVVLLLLMAAASFVSPRPIEFVVQPLGAEQRELLTRYTLEWQSPFGPGMAAAAFHPWYEILLAFTGITFLLSLRRLRPATWLLVGCFLVLSLKAHRFRVEFALTAAPLLLEQLRSAPLVEGIVRRQRRRAMPLAAAAAVLTVAIMLAARDRVDVGAAVSDRFPSQAFDFVRDENIAKRSFHTVGFGSYLIWDLYPERQSFVDGRNISAPLYRDFLACQTSSQGFNATIRKYDLDGFVIPAPEKSDGGMRNVHGFLIDSAGWALVHMDRNAFVYVKRNTVPADWLQANAFDTYHPMTFGGAKFSEEDLSRLDRELEKAARDDPLYARAVLDRARYLAAMNRAGEASHLVTQVLMFDPGNKEAADLSRQLGDTGNDK